jgi:hypothetical protein
MRIVQKRQLIAECNPHASKTFQNDAAFGIGDALDRAVTFICFAPRIHL